MKVLFSKKEEKEKKKIPIVLTLCLRRENMRSHLYRRFVRPDLRPCSEFQRAKIHLTLRMLSDRNLLPSAVRLRQSM